MAPSLHGSEPNGSRGGISLGRLQGGTRVVTRLMSVRDAYRDVTEHCMAVYSDHTMATTFGRSRDVVAKITSKDATEQLHMTARRDQYINVAKNRIRVDEDRRRCAGQHAVPAAALMTTLGLAP